MPPGNGLSITIITRSIMWVEGWAAVHLCECVHLYMHAHVCIYAVGGCDFVRACESLSSCERFPPFAFTNTVCAFCPSGCFCFGVGVNMSAFISIFLSENAFPGLKCQLSTVSLCGFYSVWR